MGKKLVVIAGLVAALSAFPGSASACPDPDNPCDPTPKPLPTVNLCKIDPRC